MGTNRLRHPNSVPLGAIATWVMVCVFIGGAGIGYVYLKNQIHASGAKIKTLERELADLATQDEVIRAKIASLSSRAALQRRVDEGFINLIPISDHQLVRVDEVRKEGNHLRAVANERSKE